MADDPNLYSYCFNNPVNTTDPTGHVAMGWQRGAGLASATINAMALLTGDKNLSAAASLFSLFVAIDNYQKVQQAEKDAKLAMLGQALEEEKASVKEETKSAESKEESNTGTMDQNNGQYPIGDEDPFDAGKFFWDYLHELNDELFSNWFDDSQNSPIKTGVSTENNEPDWINPVKEETYISSPAGPRTDVPGGGSLWHTGADYAPIPRGTKYDVVSIGKKGVVIEVHDTVTNASGKYVKILYAYGIVISYCHLDQIYVIKNIKVAQGQVIAKMDNTTATIENMAVHVHVTARKYGQLIDPVKLINEGKIVYLNPPDSIPIK